MLSPTSGAYDATGLSGFNRNGSFDYLSPGSVSNSAGFVAAPTAGSNLLSPTSAANDTTGLGGFGAARDPFSKAANDANFRNANNGAIDTDFADIPKLQGNEKLSEFAGSQLEQELQGAINDIQSVNDVIAKYYDGISNSSQIDPWETSTRLTFDNGLDGRAPDIIDWQESSPIYVGGAGGFDWPGGGASGWPGGGGSGWPGGGGSGWPGSGGGSGWPGSGGSGWPGSGGSWGWSGGYPVVLDLTGQGIHVTPRGASNQYFNMAGDGYQHATAWAGAGNGVLVLDLNGNGVIDQANQVNFTLWDPTATSDMEALLDVFDTNHDGKLNAGDADWTKFKVLVTNADGTTQLETLQKLGIASIDLTADNQTRQLSDGSSINGTTSYTRTDGTTGTAADVTFAYDANGYRVVKTVTTGADGSTTIDNKAYSGAGSLAQETISTTSADGTSVEIRHDNNGDGVVDATETDVTARNADGSATLTVTNLQGAGARVLSRTVTTTSADLKTITINRDTTGSGTFDQIESDVWNAAGDLTVTVSNLNSDGSIRARTVSMTSADGLSKTVRVDSAGRGIFDLIETDITVIGSDRSRTETVTDSNTDGSLRQQTVTLTSSDHRTKTKQIDADGDGTIDLVRLDAIVVNADGSTVSTQRESNGNGSLRDQVLTTQSADGLSKVTQTDADGNGVFEKTTTDVTVVNSDGSRTETVTSRSADSSLRAKTVTTRSQDSKTFTAQADTNGDGAWDAIETVALNASGASVDTASLYNHDGSLRSRTVTTTSADGRSVTTLADVDGDGATDRTRTDVTVLNGGGGSTETIADLSANGTLLDRTVITMSADGLSKTTQSDPTGAGSFLRTEADVTVVGADGSSSETVTTTNSNGSLRAKTVTATSSDRRTISQQIDADGDGHVDQTVTKVLNADGSSTATVADYAATGALLDRTVVTTSANGLSVTTQKDSTGTGAFNQSRTDVTVLNSDGSRTETVSDFSANGTLIDKTVVTKSANGLSTTTQQDSTGSGTFDRRRTDVVTLNADGSTTETIADFTANGTLLDKAVVTKSASGLSVTTKTDRAGSGIFDQSRMDVTVLNADGSRTETVSDFSASGALLDKRVVTTSADGSSVTTSFDANNDGRWDSVETVALNASGASVDTASLYNHDGSLRSRTVTTTSAVGRSVTTLADVDGDGPTDRTRTDVTVLNAGGGSTETIADFSASGTLLDRAVITISADGLSKTTQSDPTGAGSFLRTEADVTVVGADGSSTETVTTANGNSSLRAKMVTTTSSDRRTISQQIDADGDGHVDQTVTKVLNADGSSTATVADYAATGALLDRTVVTTSANGLSVTTQQDSTGTGTFNQSRTDVTVLNDDGSRTETVSDFSANGTLIDRTVVTKSANGLSTTTQQDSTGSGAFDRRRTDVVTLNADGSTTETITDFAANGTLLDKAVVTKSASGLSVTTKTDGAGSGIFDQTRTDVTVLNADGGRTETVSDFSASGALLDKRVVTTSADGSSVTTSFDTDGDGRADQTEVDLRAANGAVVKTLSDYAANGVLKDRLTVTTSASGLSVTSQYDSNGDGIVDKTRTDVTVLNADGSRTETITNLNASGGLIDRAVITTSANGLSKTTQEDVTGSGTVSLIETDVTVLGADGSSTETVTDTTGTGVPRHKIITTVSSDGRTKSVSRDVDGDGVTDQSVTTVVNADGSTVSTVADFKSNNLLKDRAVITTSANGLSVTTQRDSSGTNSFDQTTTDVTVLNADGSKTETTSNFSGATLKDRVITSSSANGLSKLTQWDLNGDGTVDESQSSTTVLNADGSRVQTTSTFDVHGALVESFVETTSANGLSKTTQWNSAGATGSQTLSDVTVLNTDGSTTETVTASGESVVVTTTSANGQQQTISYDTNADGVVDKTRSIIAVSNADGSSIETVMEKDGHGNLIDRSIKTTSADHRTVTTLRDVDGDGVVDQAETDTTAVDGSVNKSITDLSSSGAVLDRTIIDVSADGLTTTTRWQFTGSGVVDRTRTDVMVKNADGSTTETVTDRNSDNTLYQQGVTTTSADGRSKTLQEQTPGHSYMDRTEQTTINADGSSVTLVQNRDSANNLVSQTRTSVSADGLTKTVDEDTTGTNNFNGHATTVRRIDGSSVTDATSVDPTTHVTKHVVTSISADGLTKTIKTDSTNSGWFDSVATEVTRIDGSVVTTTAEFDSTGTVKSKAVAETSANGAEKAARVKNYQDGTETLTVWDESGTQNWSSVSTTYAANGNLKAQAVKYRDGRSTATIYDTVGDQAWSMRSATYGAAGEVLSAYTLNDNGTGTRVFYDPQNVADFSTVTNTYNAQGALTYQQGTYDNGSGWTNNYGSPASDGGTQINSVTPVGAPIYSMYGQITATSGSTWKAGSAWVGYSDDYGHWTYIWQGTLDPVGFLQELGSIWDYARGIIYSASSWALPANLNWQSSSPALNDAAAEISQLLGQAVPVSAVGVKLPAQTGSMGAEWRLLQAADYSGDGTADLLWVQNGVGNAALWTMGNGSLVSSAATQGHMGAEWTPLAANADFNHDGKADIVWTSAGSVAIWEMDGTSLATFATPSGKMGAEWTLKGLGDFNRDGNADLMWVNTSNQVAMWFMNGATLGNAVVSSGQMGAEWSFAGVGNFEGSGKNDILWVSKSGAVSTWSMNGAAVTSVKSIGQMLPTWRVAGIGDINKDGSDDIVWVDPSNNVKIWEMKGGQIVQELQVTGEMGAEWTLASVGDVTGDGRADLVWVTNGTTSVWDLSGSGTGVASGIGTANVVANALTVIQTDGATSLTQVGTHYFLYDRGNGPELKYQGAAVSVGQFGATANPIGATAVSGGYDVVWKDLSTGQYNGWLVDGSGNYVSQLTPGWVAGTSRELQQLELVLRQDLNGDGQISQPSQTIRANGSTLLAQVGNLFFLDDANFNGLLLRYQGNAVTSDQFGAVAPTNVAKVAGGYDVLWKHTDTGAYEVWSVDGGGNYVSTLTGSAALAPTNPLIQEYEKLFNQDIDGDGRVGPVATTVEALGSTALLKVGDNFILESNSGASPNILKFSGSPASASYFAGQGWTIVGAEAIAGGYEVAWRNVGAGLINIWSVDSSGNYVAGLASAAPSNAAVEPYESVFNQDLNGDGTIGPVGTTVEALGSTKLVQVGDNYVLTSLSGDVARELIFSGSAASASYFTSQGWAIVGAEAITGGYEVAWRNAGAGFVNIWKVDGAGNYVSGLASAAPSNAAVEQYEPVFHQDFNGDGAIGAVGTTIESVGSTKLVQVGDNYVLTSPSGDVARELVYSGSAVSASNMTGQGWSVIGAEAVTGGYLVAWRNAVAGVMTIWSVDGSGNYVSNPIPAVAPSNVALEQYEPVFHQDLNGDGTVGPIGTTIEAIGSTRLVQVGDNYVLTSPSGDVARELFYSGSAVSASNMTGQGWSVTGAEAVNGGYLVAWRNAGAGVMTIWAVDGSGNYVSNPIPAVAPSNAALEQYEPVFHQDLNGDGTIGPVGTTIEALGSTKVVQVGDNYVIQSNAIDAARELQFSGAPASASYFAGQGWALIGAEAVAGGYKVAWKNAGAGLINIWDVDSNGSYAGSLVSAAPSSIAIKSAETTFQQDLNGDGAIGATGSVIEAQGATSLVQVGDNVLLKSNATSATQVLQFSGTAASLSYFAGQGWTLVGAEAVAGGYDVVWKNANAGIYDIWSVDSNGNYVGGLLPIAQPKDPLLESFEVTLQQDINGDGIVGLDPAKSLWTGDVVLAQLGNGYGLYNLTAAGTNPSGITLRYQGAAVSLGQFGANVSAIGAVAVVGGYEVLWKDSSAGTYGAWYVDSGGNYVSMLNGNSLLSGSNPEIESFELVFRQDINQDGVLGTANSVIEASTYQYISLPQVIQAAVIDPGASLELSGGDSSTVAFKAASGRLILDHSDQFTGQILGFSGDGTLAHSNAIDLRDMAFSSAAETYNGNSAGGILTVSDGIGHVAQLSLIGDYTSSAFNLISDGAGGTLVVDPPIGAVAGPSASIGAQMTGTVSQDFGVEGTLARLIQAMATMSGPSAAFDNPSGAQIADAATVQSSLAAAWRGQV
ncbi:FG-GAP-like repeat-containing protein [Bradyrhizobium sp. HKCCYLS2033]|uniref:FG-GAP-like repeat-containing protein n=1 Tax=unclassified Bradyrhizobium TaxID=2631580 RepID=UPI003EB98359